MTDLVSQFTDSVERVRPHYKRAAFGLLSGTMSLAAGHLYFGDGYHAGFFIAVSLITIFFRYLIDSISKRSAYLFGGFITLFMVVGGTLIYPLSCQLLSCYIPLVLILASLTRRSHVSFLFGISILFYAFVYYSLGFEPIVDAKMSGLISIILCLSPCLIMSRRIVSISRVALSKQLTKLHNARALIEREDQKLALQGERLSKINLDLARMSKKLTQYVKEQEEETLELKEKIGDQESLVQAIHDDLRQPLRSIVSFTQLIERSLAESPEAAGAGEYLAFAKDAGQRMNNMLNDLIHYTKHAAEERSEVNLQELLGELKIDLGDTLNRNGGTLTFSGLPVVLGYQTQLRQLFQNLIANALKFKRAGVAPQVQIKVEDTCTTTCTVVVQDNGIGIPQARLESVFGLFNRAHGDQEFEGSGVGLALCRRIVLAHGATISVSSEVGVGTEFHISNLSISPREKRLHEDRETLFAQ